MKRLIVPILLLTSALSAHANPQTSLTPEQESLLQELKAKTISIVSKQQQETQTLRKCFAFPEHCPSTVRQKLPAIRNTIKNKSEEYRLLVGLSDVESAKELSAASLNLSLPLVVYLQYQSQGNSELDIIETIHQKDQLKLEEKAEVLRRTAPPGAIFLKNRMMEREKNQARQFYAMQAAALVQQLPFIIYLNSDQPSDENIVNALGIYNERLTETIKTLEDQEQTPLISFLLYEPVLNIILAEDPQKKQVAAQLSIPAPNLVGVKAWVDRNSPSIKMAALTTCSLVSAILQNWPVSIACGAAATTLTGKQLHNDYYTHRKNFVLWLNGAQEQDRLKESEGRILYSTIALFLAGQPVAKTIMGAETSLIQALSSLPSTASTRMSSLTALREGGMRFTQRTIEFKGKDLGASILAGEFASDSTAEINLPREQRIFTYADFLTLQAETAKLP